MQDEATTLSCHSRATTRQRRPRHHQALAPVKERQVAPAKETHIITSPIEHRSPPHLHQKKKYHLCACASVSESVADAATATDGRRSKQ